jgi:hypothetical protein
MKSLLMFFGSCGHVTTEEVSAAVWDRFAKNNYNVSAADLSARMVYVYPWRYCICQDCMRAIDGDEVSRP